MERAERLGYKMDTSSSGALMRSFEAIDNPIARGLLELLSFKATQRAKYFCTGMLDIAKYGHYALNVPLYTHFTSPIRRYADILVHRQLEAVLQGGGRQKFHTIYVILSNIFEAEAKYTLDRDAVAKVAQQCNMFVVYFKIYPYLHADHAIANATPLTLLKSNQPISSYVSLFMTLLSGTVLSFVRLQSLVSSMQLSTF